MPTPLPYQLDHDPLTTSDARWVVAATDGYLDAAVDHLRVLGAPGLDDPEGWSPASRVVAVQTVLAFIRRAPLVTLDGEANGRTLWEVSHGSTLAAWDGTDTDRAAMLDTAAHAVPPVEVTVENGAPALHRAA